MDNPVIDVIIPVCKPDEKYAGLLHMLEIQTVRIRQICVINTGRQYYDESRFEYDGVIKIRHIEPDEFDHGRTRHEGIIGSDADYCLLMTQDAVPADDRLVENLLECFKTPEIAVAYARQLPDDKCRIIERLARQFNYPEKSSIKRKEDIDRLGIKAFFCSDVCAAYNRYMFLKNG